MTDDVLRPRDTALTQPGPDVAKVWAERQQQAERVLDDALAVDAARGIDEDQYRAHRVRLLAADRILGFRRGAVPLPKVGEVEARDGERVIRLRWANGQLVNMPALHKPGEDDQEDRD